MELEKYICEFCGKNFQRLFNMNRHIERYHSKVLNIESCNICKATFNTAEEKTITSNIHIDLQEILSYQNQPLKNHLSIIVTSLMIVKQILPKGK